MSNSFAMVGRATVVKPLSSVDIAVISVTQVIMIAVRDFEVTVSVLSRLGKEYSSWLPSNEGIPDARELLGRRGEEVVAFVATASGGWIAVSSIWV